MSFMDQFKKYINADSNYDDYDDYDEAEDVVEDTASYADESYFNRRNGTKTTKTSRRGWNNIIRRNFKNACILYKLW